MNFNKAAVFQPHFCILCPLWRRHGLCERGVATVCLLSDSVKKVWLVKEVWPLCVSVSLSGEGVASVKEAWPL